MTKISNEDDTTVPTTPTPPTDKPEQNVQKPVSPWGVGHEAK